MTKPFPTPGFTYFWFLNDECRDDQIDPQIKAFAEAGVANVCLHPRAGLRLPYGGDDWFDFIERTASKCAEAGLGVWLYDEDPYPSGNAGGWITLEHPECEARFMDYIEADPELRPGELFCFPTGKLIWAGLVSDGDEEPVDLTARVGVVRREWQVRDPWDSRWYYPATPLYSCARSECYSPEFALKAPPIPPHMKLIAVVARPCGRDQVWGALPDTLDPAVTRMFIQRTHERYRERLGRMFGDEITAMFTDEPKYFGCRPWTRDLFHDFADTYGYDLRARLHDLYRPDDPPRAMLTRLHYREWCGRRFQEAWLRPVADWCREHDLHLVGHISPEDDLIEQANCITNLFPLQKHFGLAGLDLIIPAVGDDRHPLINIGIVTAVSVAQQQKMAGVMSETLACSGLEFTAEEAGAILSWQVAMGLTTPVIHGAFLTTRGHRLIDAPPDFGPESPRWPGMVENERAIRPVQERLIGARQAAPVAILWPIRTFMAANMTWQHEAGGLRGDTTDLLQACLCNHIGTHFIDEADLADCALRDGEARVGHAAYSHILIPSCTVVRAETVAALKRFLDAGLQVTLVGQAPTHEQSARRISPLDFAWCPRAELDQIIQDLPRLASIEGQGSRQVRCTRWAKDDAEFLLLYNVSQMELTLQVEGDEIQLPPGVIEIRDL